MIKPAHASLSPRQLRLHAIEDGLAFESTAELEPLAGVLGQQRAQQALQFGIAMGNRGYHVYVMGEPGSGRLPLVETTLRAIARDKPTPADWIYVNNFQQPREPIAIALPSGQSVSLSQDIDILIDKLLATFPVAFDSPSYQRRKNRIEREFNQRYNHALDLVERKALEMNVAMFRDGDQITFAPKRDGAPLDDAQFTQLSDKERQAFNQTVDELESYLADLLAELPQWKREAAEKQRELDRQTIRQAIDPLVTPLELKYRAIKEMTVYFSSLRKNLETTVLERLCVEGMDETTKKKWLQDLYAPNLLVSHAANGGAPVVYEPHPNYSNLFGHLEYTTEQGIMEINYRMIYAGALHRANGGYLILEANKLFTEPMVWPALKRALQRRQLTIERPLPEPTNMIPATLNPKPIPLEVKVILIGCREHFYLLQPADEEFNEIFRVLADFDDEIPITPETMALFARFLAYQSRRNQTAPLSKQAVAKLAEFSARQAERQNKFSARLGEVVDTLCEAEWFRQQDQETMIDAIHVDRAITAKESREGRLAHEILEETLAGTILIDTEGAAVGKVNGLTVFETGKLSFGAPARITATVYPGSKGIVDIEREVNLGQPIHSKGVMILSGYLGSRYAQHFPFAISAHIALEQSYGYIDGDSAALAEVCALISALTHIPIQQCFAVTGSLNQYGEVQAVGGVNEKIEGFFRLCQARGLNGQHGVLIPAANSTHLILKEEVIAAVEAGQFAIYPVTTVDQALELLTGCSAGVADVQGNYPEDSVNGKAVARLKEIAEMYEHYEEGKESQA